MHQAGDIVTTFALTVVFVVVFFVLRVAIQDAIRDIGSDRRARRRQDSWIREQLERSMRDDDRRRP